MIIHFTLAYILRGVLWTGIEWHDAYLIRINITVVQSILKWCKLYSMDKTYKHSKNRRKADITKSLISQAFWTVHTNGKIFNFTQTQNGRRTVQAEGRREFNQWECFFSLCEALIFTYRPQTRHNKTAEPIYLKCFHCSSSTLIYYSWRECAGLSISLPSSFWFIHDVQWKYFVL